MLYDIVEKHPRSRVYREAVFYLADSLHQKHDFLSARDYFKMVVHEFGEGDKHYQEALQRLIELSLRLHDDTDVKDWLARLDRIPQGQRSDAAPYVRGKYAYFSGNHDEALTLFGNIAKGSKYYFQARYFMGTAHVARKDLAPAAKVFGELLKEPARTKAEKRIVELAHLALGRLHYEREQLSEAVDEYLKIGRRSDLFDDALFEVSWVYVKAKQFDKALRSLELLALANPKSAMLPDVRILEGNLRIRKAQSLVTTGHGNSAEEYAKAVDVFEKTRDAYVQPREELQKLMAQQADPQRFFAQITGQSLESFDTEVALPQMAAAWVREEPEVGRVVTLTGDLGKIRTELDDTGALLDRLERAVTSPSRVNIFPELADRRARAK